MTDVTRYDTIQIKATRTKEGYLEDSPILTRTGIFEYRDPQTKKIRREYRPPEEVFHTDSLASYRGKPIISAGGNHGLGLYNSKNVKQHQVGTLLSVGRQDGDHVLGDVIVHDPAAVDDGHKDLSLAYHIELDETPGEINGQPYDAVQRKIRVDNCAIVKTGRAGVARFNLDAADFPPDEEQHNMPDVTLAEVRLDSGISYKAAPEVIHELETGRAALKTTKETLVTVTTRADQAEAKRDSLAAELETAKKSLEQVRKDAFEEAKQGARARVQLETALTGLKISFKADDNDIDLKKLVIKKVRGDSVDLTGKSDEYVNVSYDLALDLEKEKAKTVGKQREQLGTERKDTKDEVVPGVGSAREAQQRMIARQRGEKEKA